MFRMSSTVVQAVGSCCEHHIVVCFIINESDCTHIGGVSGSGLDILTPIKNKNR